MDIHELYAHIYYVHLSNEHTKSIPAKDERIIASLSSRLGPLLWLELMACLQR